MREHLKRFAELFPPGIGMVLNHLPMSVRLGRSYTRFRHRIDYPGRTEAADSDLLQIKRIALHAYNRTPFYEAFYRDHSFNPSDLTVLSDLQRIPIVTKDLLRSWRLELPSVGNLAMKRANTGGTSGAPLSFYVEKGAYAREWAHMHNIWGRLGYKHTDLKLTIRGRNIGNHYSLYNFNQNEFLVNTYLPLESNLQECRRLVLGHNIKWIHGYPSAVFSFLREIERTDSYLFEVLIRKLKGAFLGSEFPAPHYRDYIERHCGLRSISWYGHSEMAILAPEFEPGSGWYWPFQTYGFVEAVPIRERYHLVGTSVFNYASPFIRYDTEDIVDPRFENGKLKCFRIEEGRKSDIVIDKNEREISLTALIFGRHHRAFDYSDHVQVRQTKPGSIEILIVSDQQRHDWEKLFDFENTFFDISFSQIVKPVVTQNGKIRLLV